MGKIKGKIFALNVMKHTFQANSALLTTKSASTVFDKAQIVQFVFYWTVEALFVVKKALMAPVL